MSDHPTIDGHEAMIDGAPFQPVTRLTISEQIRNQLLKRVQSGDLAPGARVPSERDLCAQFEVARTSVREAMQGLASIGVIERRGNRSYVVELVPEFQIPGQGDERKVHIRQLFETRRVLELPIFELASVRGSEAELDRISAIAAQFDEGMDVVEFRALDREFHTTIASACDNAMLVELYGKVLDALFRSKVFDSVLYASANRAEVASIVEHASADHRAIAAAIARRDGPSVLITSGAHLDDVEARMLDRLV